MRQKKVKLRKDRQTDRQSEKDRETKIKKERERSREGRHDDDETCAETMQNRLGWAFFFSGAKKKINCFCTKKNMK